MDFSKFVAKHPDDPSLNGQGRQYCYITDFSAGIYYQALKKLYFSLSASQLRQAEGEMGQSSFKLIRQYYFSGGYAFQINKSNKGAPITLEPSFQIASDGVDFQFDVTGLVNFNDQFYGGVGYRFQDAVCLLVGLNYKDFNVGLSYDITTSKINKLGSYGSPEIMVGYNYKLTPPVEKRNYFNARFL
jgi:type IX secretion system PorP/SprF family membrane protein